MLIVRRIGIRSYYFTAALATLALTLLYLTFYRLVIFRKFTAILYSVQAQETMRTVTPLHTSEVYGFVTIYLMPILTVLLLGWLINPAARLAGGLKLNVKSDKISLTVNRISLFRISLIVALVAIPLTVVGEFIETFASGWLATGMLISVAANDLKFTPFILTVLIQVIAIYASTCLIVWTYNRITVLSGGIEIRFCQSGSGRTPVQGFRVTQIRPASALRTGFLLGLAILLYRFVVAPLLMEIFNLQPTLQFSPNMEPTEMIMIPQTTQTPGWMMYLLIHLFLVAHTLFNWALWALIYNWLARRFGGLELEVEGDWPTPPEQSAVA